MTQRHRVSNEDETWKNRAKDPHYTHFLMDAGLKRLKYFLLGFAKAQNTIEMALGS